MRQKLPHTVDICEVAPLSVDTNDEQENSCGGTALDIRNNDTPCIAHGPGKNNNSMFKLDKKNLADFDVFLHDVFEMKPCVSFNSVFGVNTC